MAVVVSALPAFAKQPPAQSNLFAAVVDTEASSVGSGADLQVLVPVLHFTEPLCPRLPLALVLLRCLRCPIMTVLLVLVGGSAVVTAALMAAAAASFVSGGARCDCLVRALLQYLPSSAKAVPGVACDCAVALSSMLLGTSPSYRSS